MDELTVKRSYITRVSKDEDNFHTAQVSYMGQVADVEVITPYGVYSTLPLDSHMLVWNVNGVEENRVAIGNTPHVRFKGLKPGEVVVGSPATKSNVFFKTDGSVIVTGKGNAVITIDPDGNITMVTDGTCTAHSKGLMTLKSDAGMNIEADGTMALQAPLITLNGSGVNVSSSGDVVTN